MTRRQLYFEIIMHSPERLINDRVFFQDFCNMYYYFEFSNFRISAKRLISVSAFETPLN